MTDPAPQKPAHIREFTPRSVAVGLLVALDHRRLLSLRRPEVRLRSQHLRRLRLLRLHRARHLLEELQSLGEQHRPDGGHRRRADRVPLLAAGGVRHARRRAGQRVQRAPHPAADVDLALDRGHPRRAAGGAAPEALHRRREAAVPRRPRRRRDAHHARCARRTVAAIRLRDDRVDGLVGRCSSSPRSCAGSPNWSRSG